MLQITENEILEAYDAFELSESELIELYSEGYISENTMDQLIEMGVFDEILSESAAGDAALYNRVRKNMLSRLSRPIDVIRAKMDTATNRVKAGLPVSRKGARAAKAIQRHLLNNPSLAKQAHNDAKRVINAAFKNNYLG